MTSVEELRQKLYEWCGRSVACKKAADYYIAVLQNPCYPPAGRMTQKMRKFYMEAAEKHGPPPRCDVEKLVEERLRGTALEKYVHEIAELAKALKNLRNTTSRVAAAVAAVVVAEARGVKVTRESVAARFGVSYAAVRMHIREAARLYMEMRKGGGRPAP